MIDPEIFSLGPFTVRWYGVMVAAGFLAALHLLRLRLRRRGYDPDRVEQLATEIVVCAIGGGLVGARVMFVIDNWNRQFRDNPWEAIRLWEGGLVFYGGFFGAVLLLLLWAWRRSIDIPAMADIIAPCLPLGHALGRIGCFLNGCCYGRHWEHGVRYAHVGDPVFPTQLVHAAANLVLVGVLLAMEERLPKKGQLIALYVVGYGALRFLAEFLRGDYPDPGTLTPAQWICVLLVPCGAGLFLWARLRGRSREPISS